MDMLTKIEATVSEHYAIIMAQREEILRAFIARHGCKPEECEQVIQETDTGMRYSVRRLSAEEIQSRHTQKLLRKYMGGHLLPHQVADMIAAKSVPPT